MLAHRLIEKGELRGMQKCIQQYMRERNVEIAIGMLCEGLDAAFISKISGLSVTEIQNLKIKAVKH